MSPATVNIPTVNVPQVTAIQIEIPKVDYYKGTDFIESINKIILIDDYELAKVNIPTKSLSQLIEFQKKLSLYFKDQRSISRDTNVNINNPIIHKWIEIYKNYKNGKPRQLITQWRHKDVTIAKTAHGLLPPSAASSGATAQVLNCLIFKMFQE